MEDRQLPPFTVVRGFELRRERARSLQEAFRAEFPDRDVVVHAGDVHDALQSAPATLAPYRQSRKCDRRRAPAAEIARNRRPVSAHSSHPRSWSGARRCAPIKRIPECQLTMEATTSQVR